MLEVDPALLEQRRRLGLDHWDEMWEGVLHMAPDPQGEVTSEALGVSLRTLATVPPRLLLRDAVGDDLGAES